MTYSELQITFKHASFLIIDEHDKTSIILTGVLFKCVAHYYNSQNIIQKMGVVSISRYCLTSIEIICFEGIPIHEKTIFILKRGTVLPQTHLNVCSAFSVNSIQVMHIWCGLDCIWGKMVGGAGFPQETKPPPSSGIMINWVTVHMICTAAII